MEPSTPRVGGVSEDYSGVLRRHASINHISSTILRDIWSDALIACIGKLLDGDGQLSFVLSNTVPDHVQGVLNKALFATLRGLIPVEELVVSISVMLNSPRRWLRRIFWSPGSFAALLAATLVALAAALASAVPAHDGKTELFDTTTGRIEDLSRALHMKMRFVILTPAEIDPNITHGTERFVTRSAVMVSNMIVSPSTIH